MKIGKGQKFPQVYCFGNLFDYFNNSFDYFADLFVNVHDVLLHSWWLISSHSANQIFCVNRGDEEQNNWTSQENFLFNEVSPSKGSGCGSVGWAVASDTRDPRFKSRHQQSFIFQLYIRKDENIKKEARNGPPLKKSFSKPVGGEPGIFVYLFQFEPLSSNLEHWTIGSFLLKSELKANHCFLRKVKMAPQKSSNAIALTS